MAQLKSCEMRHTILSSELEEVGQEEQQLQHTKAKIAHGRSYVPCVVMSYCVYSCSGFSCFVLIKLHLMFLLLILYHFYVHTASQHLQTERIKIDTQLRLLQEERDLVDKHLAEQQRKQAELSSTEMGLRERAGMVRGTLQSLQVSTEYILCLGLYI